MTQRNIELLQQTMQFIKDHPEKHNQLTYWTECGTPSCFAGWALHLNGVTRQQVLVGGTAKYAAFVLGLTTFERSTLFNGGNSIPMLELMVKDLVNGDALRDWADYCREVHNADR